MAPRADQPPLRHVAERLNEHFGLYLTNCRLLDEVRSEWQHIEIFEHPQFGRVMRIDGCFMTSERDEFFYHEPMVHLPATAHAGVRDALIVGGGDGGAAAELLKLPTMRRVVLCEIDGEVVRMARAWLPGLHRGAFDDPRLQLHLGDARIFIQTTPQRFDQIVLDLTDPFGPAAELYTVEFYEACRRILRPGGVISLHMGSPIHLQESMGRIHASLRAVFPIVRPYLQYVPLYGTLWCMAMASDQTDPALLSATEIDARLAARGLGEQRLYNGAMHHALLAQPNFVREILREHATPLHRGEHLGDVHDPADLPPITITTG